MNLLYILLALVILGFIVTIHELGHYLAGRALGIGITEFSIGFGPKIVQRKSKKNDIMYSLRCIPLGGYVSYIGEDENNDDPRAMNNQPVWKRFISILSGPVMNIILAYLATFIFVVCFGLSGQVLPAVSEITEGLPAQVAGMEAGDIITAVDGHEIEYSESGYNYMSELIRGREEGDPISITVDRSGEQMTFSMQVEKSESGYLVIGITAMREIVYPSFGESIGITATTVGEMMRSMLDGIKNLFFRGEGLDETMGPVGIVGFISQNVRSVDQILYLIVIISMNLGIINLLPLPALDGGRLVLLIVEAIIRRPLNRNVEGMIHLAGFGLLMLVIIFFTYKDIVRLVTG